MTENKTKQDKTSEGTKVRRWPAASHSRSGGEHGPLASDVPAGRTVHTEFLECN